MSKKTENIELKDFVSQTLAAIMDGVKASQIHAAEIGAVIAPEDTYQTFDHPNQKFITNKNGDVIWVSVVEFDVAIEASENGEGNIGVGVVQIGLGAGVKFFSAEAKTNRARFSVPLVLPAQVARRGTAGRQ